MLVTLPGSVSEAWVDTATDREVVRQGGKKTMVLFQALNHALMKPNNSICRALKVSRAIIRKPCG